MKDRHCFHMPQFSIAKIAMLAVLGVVLALAFGLAFGFLVQYLWNVIIVSVFAIRAITYWEAVGIIVLCKLLFGGHPHPHPRPKRGGREISPMHEIFGERRDEFASFWMSEGKEAFHKYCERGKEDNRE